jgi:hypothetical protein
MSVAIYWYPMGTGNLETITMDFATDLQDDDPEVSAATSETIAGGMRRQLYGDWRRVVLLRQHLRPSVAAEAETLRGLRSLHSHLIAGYSIGIAVGSTAAWGGFSIAGYPRGTTLISVPTNKYSVWGGSGAVAVNDEIILQSASPLGAREVHRVIAVSVLSSGTTLLSLSRGTRYDHNGSVFVRKRLFYPHLKMPDDQLDTPIITSSSRGQTFDLRLELREDIQEAWNLGSSGQALSAADGQARIDLDRVRGVG